MVPFARITGKPTDLFADKMAEPSPKQKLTAFCSTFARLFSVKVVSVNSKVKVLSEILFTDISPPLSG